MTLITEDLMNKYFNSPDEDKYLDILLSVDGDTNKDHLEYRENIIDLFKNIGDIVFDEEFRNFYMIEAKGIEIIFQLFVKYKIMTHKKPLSKDFNLLLVYYQNGYKFIRAITNQVFGIEKIDKKWVTIIYDELCSLGLEHFFTLFYKDKIEDLKKIVKDKK